MKKNDYHASHYQRKIDHIKEFLKLEDGPVTAGFEDIYLPHQAMPQMSLNDVTIETEIFNKKLSMPFLINAITGGTEDAIKINNTLARIACELEIGMAVGSQSLAIKNNSFSESFTNVRKENPYGLIIANISANNSPEKAIKAVEMIEADALQLHLNTAQELFMNEGDRDFTSLEENISEILKTSPVDVIVKEVGFGISKETTKKLSEIGVKWIDVGGSGGTNFINIESERWERTYIEPPREWGIPTAISILEVKSIGSDINIIASGGIRTPLDIVKSFALGANVVAIAGPLLKIVLSNHVDEIFDYLSLMKEDVKRLLLLSGARIPQDMISKEYILTGKTREWYIQRNL